MNCVGSVLKSREPTNISSGVCSSNETTEAVFSKFVFLHADSDTDESTQIQNLRSNKFCVKSGIIFAVIPFSQCVLENFK